MPGHCRPATAIDQAAAGFPGPQVVLTKRRTIELSWSPAVKTIESTPGAAAAPPRKDAIFARERPLAADFEFGPETAHVFDDMVDRSVPFYQEIQRMVCELAADFAAPGSTLYDLGCATGTTLLALDPLVGPDVHFVGVDNAEAMLAEARRKLLGESSTRHIDFRLADLHEGPVIEDASVVLMVLTLQFIRPLHRARVLRRIADGLRENGCLILVEKLTLDSSLLNRLFINYYYAMKRRHGYSDIEIAQKREALENVLIPYRMGENVQLLREQGFRHVEEFFRWYNFSALIALK
jgi:tRNA (cmo5U34)-methyltransferase